MVELTKGQSESIASLKETFRERLPSRVEEVVLSASDLLGASGWERPRLEALFHLVHRLTGSAAIYGFMRVSRAAGALEVVVTGALERNLWPTEELRGEIGALAEGLSRAGAEEAGPPVIGEEKLE